MRVVDKRRLKRLIFLAIFLGMIQKVAVGQSNVEVKMIKLPEPDFKGMALEEAIEKRRSIRSYSKRPLTQKELSQLLFAAQGITGKMGRTSLRAAPSAGATYPFNTYIIVNNVEDIPQGIYHYQIQNHSLKLIRSGDFKKEIKAAALGQNMLNDAGATFVLSAVFSRTQDTYGRRGLNYIYMEAGHISQNIYLQATSLGLGSVSVAAFSDGAVNKILGVDGKKEAVLYLHPVGALK